MTPGAAYNYAPNSEARCADIFEWAQLTRLLRSSSWRDSKVAWTKTLPTFLSLLADIVDCRLHSIPAPFNPRS